MIKYPKEFGKNFQFDLEYEQEELERRKEKDIRERWAKTQ